MRISDANAATRVGRWAHSIRDLIPADVRGHIADLAEQAKKKLLVGLTDKQLAELRGES